MDEKVKKAIEFFEEELDIIVTDNKNGTYTLDGDTTLTTEAFIAEAVRLEKKITQNECDSCDCTCKSAIGICNKI
jgi:hypothetical protein